MAVPDRWYFLRHPEGFSPEMFNIFCAACRIWKAKLQAYEREWQVLPTFSSLPLPGYVFSEPELRDNSHIAAFGVGSDGNYVELKLLEEEFPSELYGHYPLWFHLDLDFGRQESNGWFPNLEWHPIVPDRESVRDSIFYQKPSN